MYSSLITQYFLGWPARPKSISNCVHIYSGKLGPFSEAKFFTSMAYKYIVSSISCLFFSAIPPAVFFIVAAVIVYSVYGITNWWVPHIFVECFKHSPLFAYLYPSFSVMFICVISFVCASLYHGRPYIINSGVGFQVPILAPARTASSVDKISVTNRPERSAFTLAVEVLSPALVYFYNFPRAKYSSDIFFHAVLCSISVLPVSN